MRTNLTIAGAVIAALSPGALAGLGAADSEESRLLRADATAGDLFGGSVGISAQTIVVGAPFDDDRGSLSGSVYLFDAAGGVAIDKLLPGDGGAGDSFGSAVAVDGQVILVGAPFDDDHGHSSGSAYLFEITSGQQLAKLTASDAAAGDAFGRSVAIHGTIAVVGAPGDDGGGTDSGCAYLFDVASGDELARIQASDGALGDAFGAAVAISDTVVIVGAPGVGGAAETGAAYLFDITDLSRIRETRIVAHDLAEGDGFGRSVATSNGLAIVGSPGDDDRGSGSGSAYLIDTATGSELAKLVPGDGEEQDQFGFSVALDGTLVLVGARYDDDKGPDSGCAYHFEILSTAVPVELHKYVASDCAAGAQFGISVAISGTRLVVGAWTADGNGRNAGSSYLYLAPTAFAHSTLRSSGGPDGFTSGISLDGLSDAIDVALWRGLPRPAQHLVRVLRESSNFRYRHPGAQRPSPSRTLQVKFH